MKNLVVYKGFSLDQLSAFDNSLMLDANILDRLNPLLLNDSYRQKIIASLVNITGDKWITYEEFSLLCNEDNGALLLGLLTSFGIKLQIILNNIYPEIYPIPIDDNNHMFDHILRDLQNGAEPNDDEKKILNIYNEISKINDKYYVRYTNTEYDFLETTIEFKKYYPDQLTIPSTNEESDFIFEIGEDDEKYIEKINILSNGNYSRIGIKLMMDTVISRNIYQSFCAFLINHDNYKLTSYNKYGETIDLFDDFYEIATTKIKVPNFKGFNKIPFYSNPGINNESVNISQDKIMTDMVIQAKKARECEEKINNGDMKSFAIYRDIFVTAPTGAGKSVIFQIPAAYLASKYGILTLIITPLVELMNDQVRNLKERGYNRAERINSSINPLEKNKIVERIKNGEIDLVYLSPETLLSYSMDTLIGDRQIGLVIVDEAHIVSTWGKGFRPDYWYLGRYLGDLRKFRNKFGAVDKNRKVYCFPICTFTATAVYGGENDSVFDIKTSLNLIDPIEYIGTVKRNDIHFDIALRDNPSIKNKDLYLEDKAKNMANRMKDWLSHDEKTIIYFPYKSTANDVKNASGEVGFNVLDSFRDAFTIYTGSYELDSSEKQQNMLDFKSGKKKIMLATKAFGMGIDINDINNVYHFAASGNLNDYIQEIGRAARSTDLEGYAITDYYKRDLNYMKALFGMSAINNYQVLKILTIIYNTYDSKRKYNLLMTPDMFKSVFSTYSDEELESKVKTALLTIEKDLEARYRGTRPLVTRPRSLFTHHFVSIDTKREKEILSSKIGKYFTKIADARNKEKYSDFDRACCVSDIGDIFSLNLKDLWEDQFDRITFGEFKHKLYGNSSEIFGQFSNSIFQRVKLTVKMLDNTSLSTLRDKLLLEVGLVSEVLAEYYISGEYFTKDELANKLKGKFGNRDVKAHIIANSYLEMIDSFREMSYNQQFYERREINNVEKFHITNSSFRTTAEGIIYKSSFFKARFKNLEDNEFTSYIASDRDQNIKSMDALNLAMLFGIINLEIIGGNRPEMSIRINKPDKIRQIVKGSFDYQNKLVNEAKRKHISDVNTLNFFFTKLSSDEERWNFIEDYYLGKIADYKDRMINIFE